MQRHSRFQQYRRWIIPTCIAAYALYALVHIALHSEYYQWDFRVYYAAAEAHEAGANPYTVPVNIGSESKAALLHFVYPPLTLELFRFWTHFEYPVAAALFVLLKTIALLVLLRLWGQVLFPRTGFLWYIFVILAFNAALPLDFSAGNITVFTECLLWSGFTAWLRGRLSLCAICIVTAALFKLTPLLFLLLLLFSDKPQRYRVFITACAACVLILTANLYFYPELSADFLARISGLEERGSTNPSGLALLGDITILVGNKIGLHNTTLYQYTAWLVWLGVLLWFSRHIVAGAWKGRFDKQYLIFFFCLLYALAMPRFKDYSYILLLAPCYYAITGAERKTLPWLYIPAVLPLVYAPLPGMQALYPLLRDYLPFFLAAASWVLLLRAPLECTHGANAHSRLC